MNHKRFVKKYIKNFMGMYIIYIALVLIYKATSIVLPYSIGKYIDNINSLILSTYILKLIILIGCMSIIIIISEYMLQITETKIISKMSFNFINDTVEHIKRLPIDYFKNLDTVYLNQRINEDAGIIVKFIIHDTANLIIQIVYILAIIFMIFNISSKAFCFTLIIIPVSLFSYHTFKKHLYKSGFELRESQNKFFSKVNDQFNIIKSIKRQCWFEKLNSEIKSKFDIFYKKALRYTKIDKLYTSNNSILKYVSILFLIILGSYEINNKNLTIGDFIILNSYFTLMIDNLVSIMTLGSDYQNYLVAVKRMNEILEIQEEHNGTNILDYIDVINVKNVNFTYPNSDLALNINYTFEKGKAYCIKGLNGKGKTTLFDILVGLRYDYTGEIYFNDLNIKEIDMYKCRRSLISFVEQEPELSCDSIRNSLTYDIENYNKDYLKELCIKMNIVHLFKEESTGNKIISGGEKQKIAEIRAFIKQPQIFLFDEPISALDQNSIVNLKEIISNIKNDAIVLLITHNDLIMDIVDEIIEL